MLSTYRPGLIISNLKVPCESVVVLPGAVHPKPIQQANVTRAPSTAPPNSNTADQPPLGGFA